MPDEKDQPKDQNPPAAPRAAAPVNRPTAAPSPPRPATTGGKAAPAAPAPVDPAVIAAATAGAVQALERQRAASIGTPDMDKTVPGGVYIVEGKVVDAHGNERELPEETSPAGDGNNPPGEP